LYNYSDKVYPSEKNEVMKVRLSLTIAQSVKVEKIIAKSDENFSRQRADANPAR
jgi:hypothetical protein